MSFPFLERRDPVVRIRLHIQPGAKRNQVVGLHGEALKVQIKAPPEDGRANAELLGFLAAVLEVSKRDLTLVTGLTSRQKVVEVANRDWDHLVQTFHGLLNPNK